MSSSAFPGTRLAHDLVQGIIDVLPVTDRVYHELAHTQPLVEELINRVRTERSSGRVLLIAPNTLLTRGLIDLGYEVRVWHVIGGTLTDDLRPSVVRTGSLTELLANKDDITFDVVVLPYVLEACDMHPAMLLARLRELLAPSGALIVAYRQGGALSNRLRAAAGRSLLPDPLLDAPPISLSWPPLPPTRVIIAADLRRWCAQSALQVVRAAFICDRRATVPVKAMAVGTWLRAQAAHRIKRYLPPLRDCEVLTLRARNVQVSANHQDELPFVSVIAPSQNLEAARKLLRQFRDQSYPATRFELILVHDAKEDFAPPLEELPFRVRSLTADCPDGPAAMNRAVATAAGPVIAFTDVLCRIPKGWLEAGATTISNPTVALTGPVLLDADSALPFLALPGSRPMQADEGCFSPANAFYLKSVFEEVGGFAEASWVGGESGWAWHSQLAYRLRASGYAVGFEEAVHVFRRFPFPARHRWVKREFRQACDLPAAVRRSPGMGSRLLPYRTFASTRTMYFDLMLAGLALATLRRRPAFALLSLPWLGSSAQFVRVWPPGEWKASARNARGIAARHLIWCAGLLVGSIKVQRPVL